MLLSKISYGLYLHRTRFIQYSEFPRVIVFLSTLHRFYSFQIVFYSGPHRFGHVDFKGTFRVEGSREENYVGFVYGFQSVRKFYLAMWKKRTTHRPSHDDNRFLYSPQGFHVKVWE